jgi:hypothetical protein
MRDEELNDRVDLVDAVFYGGAGEDKGVGTPQALDGDGRLGLPVLDALGLVQNDHIGRQDGVDFLCIRSDLFVVDDVRPADRPQC